MSYSAILKQLSSQDSSIRSISSYTSFLQSKKVLNVSFLEKVNVLREV